MVTELERAVLIDFGSASVSQEHAGVHEPVLGWTLAYTAPERVVIEDEESGFKTQTVTRFKHSDVYSFGLVAWTVSLGVSRLNALSTLA
jgi:serine/threonine protein kinase